MKKLSFLTISIVIISVSSIQAQGFHLGVKAGTNISQMTGRSFDEGFQWNFMAGAFAELNFTSHWDAEVRPKYGDIDLTLAGHTHGMQFGIEIPGFRWSPVKYVYDEWAGLYETGRQKLYVNRGFGFIGYPGRVGILPEITLIELV